MLKYNFPEDSTKIQELPGKIARIAFEELRVQAELFKGLAQVYCHVDTGSCRDSIRIEDVSTSEGQRTICVRAGGYIVNPKTGKLVNYAAILEAKYPFMAPAWAQVQGQIEDVLNRRVPERVQNE